MRKKLLAFILAGCMIGAQALPAVAEELPAAEAETGIEGGVYELDAAPDEEPAAGEGTGAEGAEAPEESGSEENGTEMTEDGSGGITAAEEWEYAPDEDAAWEPDADLAETAVETGIEEEEEDAAGIAAPPQEEEITATLTVPSETIEVNTSVNGEITLSVEESPRDVRVRIDGPDGEKGEWAYLPVEDSDGPVAVDLRPDRPGTYTIYAEVTFDEWRDEDVEDDARFWYRTNTVTVEVTEKGEVGDFTVTAAIEETKRGDILPIDITYSGHADYYCVDFERKTDDSEDGSWEPTDIFAERDTSGTIEFDTAALTPGKYRLIGYASGEGYEGKTSSNGWAKFTITEPELPERTVLLSVNKDEVETGEKVRFRAFAPGAVYTTVYMDFENEETWEDGRGGDYYSDETDYAHAGKYTMRAGAWFEGEEEPVYSEPIAITVENPDGDMHVAVPEDLPDFVRQGEGLAFTAVLPEHADRMDVRVWYTADDEEGTEKTLYERETERKSIRVEIPASATLYIPEGRAVCVGIYARGKGYNDDYRETYRTVLDPAEDASLRLGNSTPAVNEEVRIYVNTGGEGVKAVRIADDEAGGRLWGGREFYADEIDSDGVLTVTDSWWTPGRHVVYAQVTRDERGSGGADTRTWTTTEPVAAEVYEEGHVGRFKALPGTDSVKRGEVLYVTYTKSENADRYWVDVDVRNGSGEWERFDSLGVTDRPGTAGIMTAGMEPGQYRMSGMACGAGYAARSAETGPREFTVMNSGLPEKGVLLTADRTEAETGEDVRVSVYAPGASAIELYPDAAHSSDWMLYEEGSDSYVECVSYGHPGTYSVCAVAVYEGSPEQRVSSDPLYITVTAEPGKNINTKLPELPDYVEAGSPLAFTAALPENAERGHISAGCFIDERYVSLYEKDLTEPETKIVIPGTATAKLGAGTGIRIDMDAEARGYEAGHDSRIVPVIDQGPAEVVLTADKKHALPDGDVVTLTTADAKENRKVTEAAVWVDDELLPPDKGGADGMVRSKVLTSRPGVMAIYAIATFEEKPEEGPDTRTWYMTKAVTVRVTEPTDHEKAEADAIRYIIEGKKPGEVTDRECTEAEQRLAGLTDGETAYLGDAKVAELKALLGKVREAVEKDKEAAAAASALISALKPDAGIEDARDVIAADYAYIALSDTQKTYIDKALTDLLETAKKSVAEAKKKLADMRAKLKKEAEALADAAVNASGEAVKSPSKKNVRAASDAVAAAQAKIKEAKAKGADTSSAEQAAAKAGTLLEEAEAAMNLKIGFRNRKVSKKLNKAGTATSRIVLKQGTKMRLKAYASDGTAKKYKITYKTGSKKTASVSRNGVIKARKPGKTTITVKAGTKQVKVRIRVK